VEAGLLHALDLAAGVNGTRAREAGGIVTLSLARTKVTDAGLKDLKDCKKIRTSVTDAGLAELKGLKQLTVLYLMGPR
jgi:hypothetical protein